MRKEPEVRRLMREPSKATQNVEAFKTVMHMGLWFSVGPKFVHRTKPHIAHAGFETFYRQNRSWVFDR
jgi:hypothetical protein